MLFRKPELKSVFEDPPMAALRQPPNLKKILCRSKLYSMRRTETLSRKCHKSAQAGKNVGKGAQLAVPSHFHPPPK